MNLFVRACLLAALIFLANPVSGEIIGNHPWNPWGAVFTYGAVMAVYSRATGSEEYKGIAWQVLNFASDATDQDGCPQRQRGEVRVGGAGRMTRIRTNFLTLWTP